MKEKPGLSFWYDSILVGSLIKYEERKVHHEIVGMMKKQQANLNMSFSCIIFFHRFSLCMSTTSWSFCRWYFFHSSNSHKYICFGWIFFLRLAHIGGRSRTLPFFCCFTRMRTFRSAAICLQVLVQDYLLSAVKHTHTHTESNANERWHTKMSREKIRTRVMGKAFFSSIECRVRQAPQSGTRRKMRERGRKKELENKHSMCDTYHRNAPQVVHTQCSCVRAYVWPISLSAFSVALQLFI